MSLPGTDADGDTVWFVVRRTIDGSVVRTIETLSSFYVEGRSVQQFPIYGHCAGYYSGAAISTVTGLGDFEGEVFGVWADGVDLGDVTVVDGEFTLPSGLDAGIIVWGLRQSSLLRTLRLTDYGTGEPTSGRPVIAGQATIDVYQTPELRVGTGTVDENSYDEGLDKVNWEDRTEYDPYDAAPFRTGSTTQGLDSNWNSNGVLVVETDSMHPATVRSISVEVQGAD